MAFMRMTTGSITRRARGGTPSLKSRDRIYNFSISKWHAMAMMSDSTILEDGYVEPAEVFPVTVMNRVHYGMERGLTVHVTQYRDAVHQKPVGALLMLQSGDKEIGYYVVRY